MTFPLYVRDHDWVRCSYLWCHGSAISNMNIDSYQSVKMLWHIYWISIMGNGWKKVTANKSCDKLYVQSCFCFNILRPTENDRYSAVDISKFIFVKRNSCIVHQNLSTGVLLTHWGRVTHIYVSKLIIIGSYNSLSPDRRQAIIWTSAGILLIGPFGTNFSEILIEILTFSFKNMRMKVSSAKRRPFCLYLNVLTINQRR